MAHSRLSLLPPLLATLALAQLPRAAALRKSSVWPQCDECEAIATQIASAFGQQLRPARLGGGQRKLAEDELEELLSEKICVAGTFDPYSIARDKAGKLRLHGAGVTPPAAGLEGVGLASGETKRHAFLGHLEDAVGGRLAAGCEEVVAEGGGPVQLYGLWGDVLTEQAKRGASLCPKLGRGFLSPWPFCSASGVYYPVKAFAHALCETARKVCKDEEKLQEERQERLDEEAAEGDEEEADSDGGDGPGDDTLTGLRQAEAPEPPPPPPKKKKKKQKQAETLNFKAPKLDEEESESTSIPVRYRCEACAAVAFQIQRGLLAAEIKYAGLKAAKRARSAGRQLRPLAEIELLEAVDSDLCAKTAFDAYGTLSVAVAADGSGGEVGAVKVLNGPGLPHGQQGMIQTGAPKGHPTWAGRLSRSCTELVGHVGEDELYAGYRELEDPSAGLEKTADGLDQRAGLFEPLCFGLSSVCEDAAEAMMKEPEGGEKLKPKKKKPKQKHKKQKKHKKSGTSEL